MELERGGGRCGGGGVAGVERAVDGGEAEAEPGVAEEVAVAFDFEGEVGGGFVFGDGGAFGAYRDNFAGEVGVAFEGLGEEGDVGLSVGYEVLGSVRREC